MANKVYDVAVIGSGPAGFTAAIYTTRGAASTLILAGEKWGGQLMLTTEVDNFPGFPEGVQGPDLMLSMRKQAERFGAEIVEKNVEKVEFARPGLEDSRPGLNNSCHVLIAGGTRYLAKSVIIATGAQTVWLDAPGVKEFIGRGVSSCAPCDAPFFRNKKVAVVGGGDTAMEEAQVLTKYASEVTIIHRRDEFRATKAMQEKVIGNPKIKILWNTEVQEVKGDGKVNKLILKNNQTGEVIDFSVDGLFVAIGHHPDSGVFKGLVKMDEKGFIENIYDNKYHSATSIPGIFVSGDVMDKQYKQAVTAAGMGCIAALDVLKYLDEVKTEEK